MGNIHTFDENVKYDVAMDIATLNGGSTAANTETYFSMAEYDLAVFLVFTGTLAGSSAVTLQMRQSIGAAGTEADLGTAGALTDADDNEINVFQARGEELNVDDGYTHVGFLCTETGNNDAEVSVILLRMRPRYKHADLNA